MMIPMRMTHGEMIKWRLKMIRDMFMYVLPRGRFQDEDDEEDEDEDDD